MNIRLHRLIFCLAAALMLLNGYTPTPVRATTSTFNFQNLTLGPSGALVGGLGDVFNIHGDLTSNSIQNIVWDTHLSQVGFNAAGPHQFTWTGTEQGRGNAGFINNFAVGIFSLPIGASITTAGSGALYARVLSLGGGVSQISSISGSGLNIHYNPGSPQNAYLNFQMYSLPNGYTISPAAAPADVNAVWNGTSGSWTDGTKWSGSTAPLNPSTSVTLYDATINSGTVTLNQNIGYLQKLNLGSGGTLTGTASVTPWDTFTWGTVGNNAISTISGGATLNANGDMRIVGDSARNLDNATINNHVGYIATWAAGNSDINFSNNAAFNNSGSFIVQNDCSLGRNGGSGSFTNAGTFTKSAGAGATSIGSANFIFNNPGIVDVQTGTLEFDGPLLGPTSGAVFISSIASMVIADGASVFGGNIASSGPLNIGDGVGASGSASLQLLVNNQIINTSELTVKSDGLLNINGVQANVGSLSVNGGNVSIGSGTMTTTALTMFGGTISSAATGKMQLLGVVNAVADAGNLPATITARTDLAGGTRTFNVSHVAAANDLLVSGNLSNGGLLKTGLGVMTLSGNNTYSAGTTLSQGTLNINTPTAIGTGAFTINGTSNIDNTSGAPVVLSTNNPQVWASNFTFTGSQSLNFGSGTVTLNTFPNVTVSANTLNVGPIANGTGNSLVKNGEGTLFVSGGAPYTGTTFVDAGTLTINGGTFASSATTVVRSTLTTAAKLNFIGGANAGSGTFTNNNSLSVAGVIQFADNGTTAGFGHYNNTGGIGMSQGGVAVGSAGAQMIFNSGASAGNAVIANLGGSSRFALSGAQVYFNGGSTAGSAAITTNGGTDSGLGGPAPGALTLFSGNADAGNSTLITNAGTLNGLPGLTEFKDTASGGTATITINAGAINTFINHASAGSASVTANSGSALEFFDSATAANATLLATGGPSFAPSSEIDFFNSTTAANAHITAASNTGAGGSLKFHDNSDAGHGVFVTATAGNAVGATQFFDSASGANGTFTTNGGTDGAGSVGGFVQFHNSSTAGFGAFTNNGALSDAANGAEMDFFDTSTAGNANVTNIGSPHNANGGLTVFSNSSRAGTATFTNTGATAATNGNNGGGYTVFNSGTTADHATFINNGSAFNTSSRVSGHTIFNAGSTADHGTFTANGAPTAGGVAGEVDFVNGATAGNGIFTINPGLVSGASGGLVDFSLGGSSGASGTFTNNGATVSGASGGVTIFAANTTAANAVVTANGGTLSGAGGATIGFFGNPDPANSTLIANGGTNGGAGGLILFIASPQSGQFFPDSLVRVVANAGGTFDSSGAGQPLSVGSIEGAGAFLLGGNALITGSLNTDTTVSGIIANNGSQGGSNAKLTKAGTGKLSLTGANTYTGATTVNAGTLSTNLLANGGVASGIGASSNGAANLVLNGGTFQYTGPAVSTDRAFTLGASSATVDSSGAGPLNFSNTTPIVTTGSGPRTLTLTGNNTGGNTIAAPIIDGAGGATSLNKSGPGTWVISGLNLYTGPTTITAGTLRYGGSDAVVPANAQAYTLNPANPSGTQANQAVGLDFNVNAGRTVTITQLGIFDDGSDGFAGSHNAYIYDRDSQTMLATVTFSAGTTAALSADGYRFLPLSTPLTLAAGDYTVVADFTGADRFYSTLNFVNGTPVGDGVTSDGAGALSYTGYRSGSPGAFPTGIGFNPPYRFGAGDFRFNTAATGRIPGDVTINGPTAVLDLGNNQNGNVATVTLDGGGSITGTGGSTLTSRTSFQLKSGTVSAILSGAGASLVKSTAGTVTLIATNTYTGNTTVSGGTLILGNSLTQSSSLSIAAGAKLSMSFSGNHVLSTPSLSINSTGILDLGDNDLIVPYISTSPLSAIRALLISGFNNGNWDGNGINSLAARNDTAYHTALGYAERSDVAYNTLDGVTLGTNAVIVKYTYYGDSNLDGVVNTADFTRFLDGLASGGTTWAQGDYTYDGNVDLGNDFNLFLTGYLTQGGALGDLIPIIENNSAISASQKAQFLAGVPEPLAVFFPLAAFLGSFLRRQPRHATFSRSSKTSA